MRFFPIFLAAAVAIPCAYRVELAHGQAAVVNGTFIKNDSGTHTWPTGSFWTVGGVSTGEWPTGEGAVANFNGTIDPVNTSTSARTIQMASAVVVGEINFNLDTSNGTPASTVNRDSRFTGGTGGSLTFNATGSGPATLNVSGTGNTRLGLEAGGATAITLTDDLVITVSNVTYSGTTGPLNVTSTITGPGGVTKNGAGTMSLTSNDKTYSGATILNAGRVRLSQAAELTQTSSFTINNGAHLEPVSDGDYTLGPGTLFLNGTGIANAGAIRPDRSTTAGTKMTITNPVELLSTSLVHSQTQVGSTSFADGRITFTGLVTGTGPFQFTAPSHDQHLGTYHLTAANTYSGGTELYGGRLIVGDLAAGFPNARLGTGDVTVFNSRAPFGVEVNSEARGLLVIPTGVLDAIDDSATLTVRGGFTGSLQQAGAVELQTGINEIIGSLVLGNTTYTTPGTYGHPNSSADFRPAEFAEYFADTPGVLQIVAAEDLFGDYNDDDVVDAADYVSFRKHFGQTSELPNDPGEGTEIDIDQYNTWKMHFGESEGGGGNGGAVPEPATLALLGLLAPLALAARRRCA